MKLKKKVTEGVLAANRANAESSTGPSTERGLLSKTIALESDDERAEFQELVRSLNAEFSPDGLLEQILVE